MLAATGLSQGCDDGLGRSANPLQAEVERALGTGQDRQEMSRKGSQGESPWRQLGKHSSQSPIGQRVADPLRGVCVTDVPGVPRISSSSWVWVHLPSPEQAEFSVSRAWVAR